MSMKAREKEGWILTWRMEGSSTRSCDNRSLEDIPDAWGVSNITSRGVNEYDGCGRIAKADIMVVSGVGSLTISRSNSDAVSSHRKNKVQDRRYTVSPQLY